ncbi:Hypothetical predicted protein, partial [Olea europaea subsp. europaea]
KQRVSGISSRSVVATIGSAMIDRVERARARVRILVAIVEGNGKRRASKEEDMYGQKALDWSFIGNIFAGDLDGYDDN